IEIIHKAKNRDIFAKGAVIAAKWIANKDKGLYSMDNVLFKS
ncbi:MAG: 4-hydroxy-tetrahydrodipicolinate reductase, partial [Candidatus Omnitrophica bacterium]|nr:4-hydroxy-tetrahydrodipicolinate reductase [Candidatus Omnitrophota bacterium]